MKKNIFFVFIVAFLISLHLNANDRDVGQIHIEHKPHGGTHSEYYLPADAPEVYYDSDNQEIIIVADGFASYYEVEITIVSSGLSVIYTMINGYGDSIDISSLGSNYYCITITSEYNNVYEGYFIVE
jgi:hypothetical protein